MGDEWLIQILDKLSEGIHIVDLDGVTRYYNRAMGRMEGLDPQEVVGKGLLSHFPTLSKETSTLWQVLKSQKPVLKVSQTYLNPRGEKITSVNDSYPLFQEGRLTGAMEVARDLSREASLTEKVVQLQNELHPPLNQALSKKPASYYTFPDIKTQSPEMLKLLTKAKRVAASHVSVLISGETGTGKEMVAQSIHAASPRTAGPFVAQNCAAFPESLLEGLLFGTVRGSFTGAMDRPGLFEQAQGGTLLLDELDSMGWNLQAKLLRVIQEGKVRRLGDTREREIDVRFLATTNRPGGKLLKEERIRPDLFYRLSVVDFYLPPLRDRKEDLQLLVGYFLEHYAELQGRTLPKFHPSVLEIMKLHEWPGNIRELAHIIEGGLVICEEEFGVEELPYYLRSLMEGIKGLPLSLQERIEEIEHRTILDALEKAQGNFTRAAKHLGISRQLLQYKMRRWSMNKDNR